MMELIEGGATYEAIDEFQLRVKIENVHMCILQTLLQNVLNYNILLVMDDVWIILQIK